MPARGRRAGAWEAFQSVIGFHAANFPFVLLFDPFHPDVAHGVVFLAHDPGRHMRGKLLDGRCAVRGDVRSHVVDREDQPIGLVAELEYQGPELVAGALEGAHPLHPDLHVAAGKTMGNAVGPGGGGHQ